MLCCTRSAESRGVWAGVGDGVGAGVGEEVGAAVGVMGAKGEAAYPLFFLASIKLLL